MTENNSISCWAGLIPSLHFRFGAWVLGFHNQQVWHLSLEWLLVSSEDGGLLIGAPPRRAGLLENKAGVSLAFIRLP